MLGFRLLPLARRYLVIVALMFWQGGFFFYTSVVVPVGTEVLGSAAEQGRITRVVTTSLNHATAVALVVLALDLATAPDRRWRRLTRWACWLGMAGSLVALYWLHARLDALIDPEDEHIVNRSVFHLTHRAYLWASTVQWGLAMVYAGLTLAAWGWDDTNRAAQPNRPPR